MRLILENLELVDVLQEWVTVYHLVAQVPIDVLENSVAQAPIVVLKKSFAIVGHNVSICTMNSVC